MADAMMMFLGEAHGVNWYWAQPGEFENPGVYYWDGAKNVLCVPHLAAAPESPAQAEQHPDDAAVNDFAQAMKYKLAAARHKGREGWQTCPPEELSRMLREHVEKGDPLDVANFCMFLWWLGHGIAAAHERLANKGD